MDDASWIADLWAWAVASTLQATLLLGLAWIADRLLVRRVWPQLLLLLWLLALARFFLPPGLGSPLSVTAALGAPTLAAAELVPGSNVLELALALWLAGALGLVALRAARRARLRSRVELVRPAREWLAALELARRLVGPRRRPRIGTLGGLETPAVFGLFRPTLLLPRSWLERAPRLHDEHALLHELAHLRRRDLWLDELCALVRALLWFHPLVWLATERIHALGELACDQTVARALGGAARQYRDTLVLAARPLLGRPAAGGLRAFLGHPNAMLVRIERLERSGVQPLALVRGASAALACVLAACVLPMAPDSAALRAQARALFAAERSGERQSCFSLQAAALVLAADPLRPDSRH